MTTEEKINNIFKEILIHKTINPDHLILHCDDPRTLQIGWICDKNCKHWIVHIKEMRLIIDSNLPILQFIKSLFVNKIEFNKINIEDYPEEIKRLLNLKAFW